MCYPRSSNIGSTRSQLVLVWQPDQKFLCCNYSLYLQAETFFLLLNNMLIWNIIKEKKDGLIPKLYAVLLGLSYLNFRYSSYWVRRYPSREILWKALQSHSKITFIKKLFLSYSHRKWLVKNHAHIWQGSAKYYDLFVIKNLENYFCWRKHVSSSLREYESLLITILCLFLAICSVSNEWAKYE